MSEIDAAIAMAIPTFDGAPTLQGLEFEQGATPGVLEQKKRSRRQYVRFYNKEIYNPAIAARLKSEGKDPRDAMERKEFVEIRTPGDKNIYNDIAEDYHKRTYFAEYRAFRDGKTVLQGRSIDDTDFIPAPVATELKYHGVYTVEQLADAADILMDQLPGGWDLREHAKNWCLAEHGDQGETRIKRLAAELNEAKGVVEKQAAEAERLRQEMSELRALVRDQLAAQPRKEQPMAPQSEIQFENEVAKSAVVKRKG